MRKPHVSPRATAAERIDVDIARLERFVERFRYKKSLAKRAQAKLTHIGRLEQERAELAARSTFLTRRAKSLGFEFLQPKRSGRTVVEADGVELAAGDKELLSGVNFAVERGEHVALVGPNGSGKTTLLETLLGRREPKKASSASATASSPRTSPSTRSSSTRAGPCSR